MARPKKENADYFSHDKDMRNDPKIRALRKKFKQGYSVFNMLLEVLTGSDNFFIELNEIEIELLAGDFDEEAEILTQIIDYCVKVKLLFKEENKIYSCGLNKRLQPVLDKRNIAEQRFIEQKLKKKVVSITETTQSKVKESKVKERKDNNSNYYPSTTEVVDEIEVIDSKKNEKEIFIDEEQLAAGLEFLKRHSYYNLCMKNYELTPMEVEKLLANFFNLKVADGAIQAKSKDEIVKNFYFWIGKYKQSNPTIKPQLGNNGNPSRSITTQPRTSANGADVKRADRKELVNNLRGLLLNTEPK